MLNSAKIGTGVFLTRKMNWPLPNSIRDVREELTCKRKQRLDTQTGLTTLRRLIGRVRDAKTGRRRLDSAEDKNKSILVLERPTMPGEN